MPRPYNPKVRCKAQIKGKGQCRRAAIAGAVVCQWHGGGSPQVKAKAKERLADLIDPDRALREAARLAYSDVRELYTAEGKLKPMKDWPDDLAAAIGGVEFVRRNIEGGDGHSDDVIKVKVWDKPKALQLLFQHLGLLKDMVEHSGKVTIGWEE
jgi:hypothetical protein